MSPRPRTRAGGAAAVRGPVEGEALLRARRKFSLVRGTYLRCTVTYIAMIVIGLGCLVTLVCLLNSQHPLWPWIAGAVAAGLLGVHAFAKQGRLEDCPHCRAHLRGFASHCPGCGGDLRPDDPACPACRLSCAAPPKMTQVHFCSTCGTGLVAPTRETTVKKQVTS